MKDGATHLDQVHDISLGVQSADDPAFADTVEGFHMSDRSFADNLKPVSIDSTAKPGKLGNIMKESYNTDEGILPKPE